MRRPKIPRQPVPHKRLQVRPAHLRLRDLVRSAACLPLRRRPHSIRIQKVIDNTQKRHHNKFKIIILNILIGIRTRRRTSPTSTFT
jgi:hypothetical protein